MLIAVAVIIFCSVMCLMLNVTIERASFGISLVKVLDVYKRQHHNFEEIYLSFLVVAPYLTPAVANSRDLA